MRREQAGVKTQLGFNYLKNPMIALAREIVASGEIGDIVSFRGIHAEDYMAGGRHAVALAAGSGSRAAA